jgi:hypothetical protein
VTKDGEQNPDGVKSTNNVDLARFRWIAGAPNDEGHTFFFCLLIIECFLSPTQVFAFTKCTCSSLLYQNRILVYFQIYQFQYFRTKNHNNCTAISISHEKKAQNHYS